MFCIRCGHSVTPGAAFCAHCGQPLTGTVQPPAQGPSQNSPMPPQGYVAPPAQGYIGPPQGYDVPPSQGYVAPADSGYVTPLPHGYDVPPSRGDAGRPAAGRKKTGMIVGIVAGAVVLAVIVAVLLFVWPGFLNESQSVEGVWYSEKRGEAIRFGSGNSFEAQTYYGDFEGDYTFDTKSGKGHIEMADGSREFGFQVEQDRLLVYNMGAFERADDEFDMGVFIQDAQKELGNGGS